jgi:hypothetical protein
MKKLQVKTLETKVAPLIRISGCRGGGGILGVVADV